jgi:uncharacterized delta-60 repeat protein
MQPLESRRLLNGGYQIETWTHDTVTGDENQFALTVAPDGSVFSAGYHRPNAKTPTRSYVVKFDPAGMPDPSFGEEGVAWLPVPSELHDVELQPDGRIVVSGQLPGEGGLIHDIGFLARLRADGSFDTTFGTDGDGIVRRPFRFGGTNVLHIADGGDIVTTVDSPIDRARRGVHVRRYDPDGRPRTSFGDGGFVRLDLPDPPVRTELRDATIAPDGRIALTGYVSSAGQPIPNPTQRVFIAMLTPDGRPEPSFGQAGIVFSDEYRWSDTIGVDAQGRAYVVGEFDVLLRFTPQGILDPTFDADGKVLLARGQFEPMILRVGPAGRIMVGGILDPADDGGPTRLRFVAYDSSGQIDLTFGDAGVIEPPGTVASNTISMAADADTIVVQDEVNDLLSGFNQVYNYTRITGDILAGPYSSGHVSDAVAFGSLEPSDSMDDGDSLREMPLLR